MPAYNTFQTFIVIQKFKWVSFTILLIKTKMHDMNGENVQHKKMFYIKPDLRSWRRGSLHWNW